LLSTARASRLHLAAWYFVSLGTLSALIMGYNQPTAKRSPSL
jgi:hypothetical protein